MITMVCRNCRALCARVTVTWSANERGRRDERVKHNSNFSLEWSPVWRDRQVEARLLLQETRSRRDRRWTCHVRPVKCGGWSRSRRSVASVSADTDVDEATWTRRCRCPAFSLLCSLYPTRLRLNTPCITPLDRIRHLRDIWAYCTVMPQLNITEV